MLDITLNIAESIGAVVMISNFGIVEDFEKRKVLCLPHDPIIRLCRMSEDEAPIPFLDVDFTSKALNEPAPAVGYEFQGDGLDGGEYENRPQMEDMTEN